MKEDYEQIAEDIIGSFNTNDREDVSEIKDAAKQMIAVVVRNCPEGRRRSKAVTEIETAAMYAVKSLFAG